MSPDPQVADLLDRVAAQAAGDAPVDAAAVIGRARRRRRARVASSLATGVLAVVVLLVAAGVVAPMLAAVPVQPAGTGPVQGPARLPATLGRTRIDPPMVLTGDGRVRAQRLTLGFTGSLRGQEVALAVDAATARTVRLPATGDDLPGLGVRSDDLSADGGPGMAVLLSPGGTVAAVLTLHRSGCAVAVVDLGRGRAGGTTLPCDRAAGPAAVATTLLPTDDGGLVRPVDDGLVRTLPGRPGDVAVTRWRASLHGADDSEPVDLVGVQALNGEQALVLSRNSEGREFARVLDLADGTFGPSIGDLAVTAGSVVRPEPAGPFWYLTRDAPSTLRRDVVGSDGALELAGRPAPVPADVLATTARLAGVDAGSAVLAEVRATGPGEVVPVVGERTVLARFDPETGRSTAWVRAEGALQASGWSLPVGLVGAAEVVPAPGEPWWAVLAPLGRLPFWSWPGLALLALVGLPGILVWRGRTGRRPTGGRRG